MERKHKIMVSVAIMIGAMAILAIWWVVAKAQCLPDDLNCMNLP